MNQSLSRACGHDHCAQQIIVKHQRDANVRKKNFRVSNLYKEYRLKVFCHEFFPCSHPADYCIQLFSRGADSGRLRGIASIVAYSLHSRSGEKLQRNWMVKWKEYKDFLLELPVGAKIPSSWTPGVFRIISVQKRNLPP